MLIADLSHHDGADPEHHPAASRLSEYLRAIVCAATSIPADRRLNSGLRCHRRPGRQPCAGYLQIVRQEVPPHVNWWCGSCEDAGRISGWQHSLWDLRPPPSFDEPLLGVNLSPVEYAELRNVAVLDPDTRRLVYGAHWQDGQLWLVGGAQEFEQLTGYVAAATNYEPSRRRQQRLDVIFGKLELLLIDL